MYAFKEFCVCILTGVAIVQTVDVGEKDKKICLRAHRYVRRQGIVVAHLDLFRGNRVVFVDDGQNAQLQKFGQSIFEILLPIGGFEVCARQKDLRHHVPVFGEQAVVRVHEFTLSDGCRRLFGGDIRRFFL